MQIRKYIASLLFLCFLATGAFSAADVGNTAVISPTDASNGSGTCPSWLGSAAPSTLDDSGRCLQGAVAREWENRSYPTATGTAPAFAVSYTVAPAALRTGQTYTFTAHAAAVGTDTLTINTTLGPKNIKKVVAGVKTATAANDFYTGDKIVVTYDGTDMVWTNPKAAAVASATTTSEGISELLTTTEVLTGTDTTRTATADSIAALWEKGADVASSGTISIGEGHLFHITGTTTITDIDFATAKDGRGAWLIFDGILTLTHHATTLILPGGANITTAAGDMAYVTQDSSDNIKVAYFPVSGRAVLPGGITQATEQASTSGTSIDFTGIPSTAKRITIMFDGVSTNGTSDTIIQIGDSGGIETSGYLSSAGPPGTILELTNGFALRASSAAASLLYGQVVLNLQDASNTWVGAGNLYDTSGSGKGVQVSAGMKQTSAVLDRVRLTTSGGVNTFDAGSINISYE